ncbi:MAG: hypothetical protein WKG03_02860 [Telluria sp.]
MLFAYNKSADPYAPLIKQEWAVQVMEAPSPDLAESSHRPAR